MLNTDRKVRLGASYIALMAAFSMPVSIARAQDQSVEQVVVTGTSLRGVAPVGSNLISVGASDLQATGASIVTQALATVPALSNFGATVQGGTIAFYQPSIHNLGASASNSTLVLIDGHRGPTGGTNHTFLDPNIIPFTMVERVDVLAEGASATYGADAVAGVINFISRKRFDGLQITGQTVLMDGASTGFNYGLVSGKSWDTGSVVFGASYSLQPRLKNDARDWTYPDQRSRGGTNFLSFNCSPATLQPGGQSLLFQPSSQAGVTNIAANGACSNWAGTDAVGEEDRYNLMARVTQDLTENLTVGLDMVYGRRRNDTVQGQPSVQATVFGSGAQANPFFRQPAGYTGANTTQTVRWDPTEVFGPQHALTGSDAMYASFTAAYRFHDNWNFDFLAAAGRDESFVIQDNQINGFVANLALNRTTNSGGSMTAVSVPGTDVVVINPPLTTANALDVWNSAATNRTSQSVRDRLLDNDNIQSNTTGFQQIRGILNGTLFEMPAGPVKIAIGGELLRSQLKQFVARANGAGPASSGSQQLNFPFERQVYAGFVEGNIPLVGPDMGIPLMRTFDVNLSYRYDHYDDFGATRNPRFAFNWDVVEDLKFRGNYSTSFVAPPLTILGDQNGAFATAGWNAVTNNIAANTSDYPQVLQFGIPGCTAASTTCNISSLTGVQVTKGDPHAKAVNGEGWSLGLEWSPTQLPGFRSQVTFFNNRFEGGVTGASIAQAFSAKSANYLVTFYPQCATTAEFDAKAHGIPQRTAAPACTQYIFEGINSNWLNVHIEGLDYSAQYIHTTDTMGEFRVGINGTQFTKFTYSFGSGDPYSILNTTGTNGQFPSVATAFRASLGWTKDDLSADLFMNYTGGYKRWSANTITPLTRDANGNPNGGGDNTAASVLFDANVSYTLNADALANPVKLSLAVRNIFDKKPPFVNGATGYDSFLANPFGRRITLGATMNFF